MTVKFESRCSELRNIVGSDAAMNGHASYSQQRYCSFKPEGPEQDVMSPLICVSQTSCYLFFHLHVPSWVLRCVSCTTRTLRLSGTVSEVMSKAIVWQTAENTENSALACVSH